MDKRDCSEHDDFPFLRNKNTVHYIRHSKVMFILRGLPGSGKSTVASAIAAKYHRSVVCSADDYFMRENGRYQYHANQIQQAHDQCRDKAKHACQSNTNVVIIDNTNLQIWQIKFYIELAAKHNYVVVVVIPRTWWCFDVKELAQRNKHGLRRSVLEEKFATFEQLFPRYWAWFLNESDSDMLKKMAQDYFSACMRKIPMFRQAMKRQHQSRRGRSFLSYNDVYGRHNADTGILHCTAWYRGTDRPTSEGHRYDQRTDVRNALGQVYDLHIIGMVITPNTIGARVALNEHQLSLWHETDSDLQMAQASGTMPAVSCSELDAVTARLHASSITGVYEKLRHRPKFSPVVGHGSHAHFSIGWSSSCRAVQTRFDHIHVIALENMMISQPRFTRLEGAVARYYDNGSCVVYFDEFITVKALFSGQY